MQTKYSPRCPSASKLEVIGTDSAVEAEEISELLRRVISLAFSDMVMETGLGAIDLQGRQVELVAQVEQQIEDLRPNRAIERRGRLVGDDHPRIERDGPGDADALALAAGELVRVAVLHGGLEPDLDERVGDDTTLSVDVRVIASTNRDLEKVVEEGGFREDLYYRLSVFPIDVPPLRERGEDIIQLASHFLEKACLDFGHRPLALSRQQFSLLNNYDWSGNRRGLKNGIERAVILSQGKVLRLDLAMADILRPSRQRSNKPDRAGVGIMTETELIALQRENMLAALSLSDGRVSGAEGAAKLLGLKPSTFTDRMKKFGIGRKRDDRSLTI